LSEANLRGAGLINANLSGADLSGANLSEADWRGVNLNGAKNVTVEQLEQAKTLEGAIMPDGVQLGQEEEARYRKRIEGPTFEEWKAQYLAKQETERAGHEPSNEPDDI
jgi:hypothetical protein